MHIAIKYCSQILSLGTLVCFIGCGADDPIEAVPSEASAAVPGTNNAEREVFTSTSVEQASEQSLQLDLPKEWLPPLDENENFFAAPEISEQRQQTIEATPQHETVRLLGFAGTGRDGSSRKAIIKIGDRMCFLAEGEERDGVEVLEILDRSVHLQRGADRWSLALLDQPMVNPAIATPSVSRSRPAPRTQSAGSTAPAAPVDVVEDAGPDLGAAAPDLPQIEMPSLPDLPELELPDFGDLP